jgi:hypothetical protein
LELGEKRIELPFAPNESPRGRSLVNRISDSYYIAVR